jgi:SAM-dependent methyltransferase
MEAHPCVFDTANDTPERGNMSAQPKRLPRFIDILSGAPAPKVDAKLLDAEIEQRLNTVRSQQGAYQPVYGMDSDENGARRDLLVQNCQFVEKHFHSVARKQQIRILDIGSNAGFVTFTLAKIFEQTLGTEINPGAIDLCTLLSQKMNSPARFANVDILEMIESGDVDFENIDCVLLFNVIHQMIFARGLPYVQAALKKIVQSVDVVFVELATREQYVPHKKDHLLPHQAEEVFKKCVDCDIQLLRALPRPLYTIRRRSLPLAADRFPFDDVKFSGNPNSYVSRKYYSNRSEFLKLYRFTPNQGPVAFHAEVRGHLALQGKSVCPEIIDWGKNRYSGYIRTERIYGAVLSDQISRYKTKSDKDRIIAELLQLARELARAGIYQNDFSSHNMIVTSDGSLRLIDFEQTRSSALYDPFAFLLWIVSDIHTGRLESYEKRVFEQLVLAKGARVSHELYPDRQALAEAGLSREFIEDAYSATNWVSFIEEWHPKFRDLSEGMVTRTEQ